MKLKNDEGTFLRNYDSYKLLPTHKLTINLSILLLAYLLCCGCPIYSHGILNC